MSFLVQLPWQKYLKMEDKRNPNHGLFCLWELSLSKVSSSNIGLLTFFRTREKWPWLAVYGVSIRHIWWQAHAGSLLDNCLDILVPPFSCRRASAGNEIKQKQLKRRMIKPLMELNKLAIFFGNGLFFSSGGWVVNKVGSYITKASKQNTDRDLHLPFD